MARGRRRTPNKWPRKVRKQMNIQFQVNALAEVGSIFKRRQENIKENSLNCIVAIFLIKFNTP